jgi:hypothetical protein
VNTEEKHKHRVGVFVLAATSFVPLVGIVTGIICIIIATVGKKSNSKLLGGLGFAGVMSSVVVYGSLFYQLLNNEEFSKGFEAHAIGAMTSLVRDIEYYKLQQGHYPESMAALRGSLRVGETAFFLDISGSLNTDGEQGTLYYEVTNGGEHYLLFSVGQDAEPFTQDDIFPIVDPEKDKNSGWVKER